jgi:hypothetical protein
MKCESQICTKEVQLVSLSNCSDHIKSVNDDFPNVFTDPCGRTEKCRIAMSLYGTDRKYIQGAKRNIDLVPLVFPGWKIRIYHDSSLSKEVIEELSSESTEFFDVSKMNEVQRGGMFWRFLVADDPSVDRFIIRDSDSRLNLREKAAIDEWIQSGRLAHNMRDHPSHRNYKISGGMWGGRHGCVENIAQKISQFSSRSNYLDDMNFLADVIYHDLKRDIMEHDSYGCLNYPNTLPFPSKREYDFAHVGQVFDQNDIPRKEDVDILSREEAPRQCRKKPEWLYG